MTLLKNTATDDGKKITLTRKNQNIKNKKETIMKTRRIILTLAVMLVMLLAFTSCDAFSGLIPEAQCEHTWGEATCTAPKTCSLCGETEGEALGHTEEIVAGKEATCTTTVLPTVKSVQYVTQ